MVAGGGSFNGPAPALSMKPSIPSNQPEAVVAEQLARAAKRRWGLPRGPSLTMAYILPTVALNLVLVFGSGWLALGPMLGFLQRPYGWILATQSGSVWLAVAMIWAFPRRYSLLHGLAGRNPQPLYMAGERRIWLIGVWFPTVFVFLIYYKFVSTVHPWAVLLPGFAIGIVLFAAAALPDHELWSDLNRLDLVLGAVLCITYGCATALQVNCIFDRSNAAVYEAMVTVKRDYSRSHFFRRGPHLTVGAVGA